MHICNVSAVQASGLPLDAAFSKRLHKAYSGVDTCMFTESVYAKVTLQQMVPPLQA